MKECEPLALTNGARSAVNHNQASFGFSLERTDTIAMVGQCWLTL